MITETTVWPVQAQQMHATSDRLIQEAPVALVYNGISHVVLMATPQDLAQLALGFSITEGILTSPSELYGLEVMHTPKGYVVEMEIASRAFLSLKDRKRSLKGRTGCGLCGIDNLDAIHPQVPTVRTQYELSSVAIEKALASFGQKQPLHDQTGAAHGVAWVDPEGTILSLFEDVGRHNALDKVIGQGVKQEWNWQEGFLLISSRASYEMVLKAAMVGASYLVAVSAPTDLAVQLAQQAQLTLIGFARPHRYVVYTGASHIRV